MSDELKEVLSRVRRIETRQMKMAIAQGVDPTNNKVRLVLLDMLPPTFEVAGLDVSLGDLVSACKTSGISGSVRIVHNGVYVGSFDPTEV